MAKENTGLRIGRVLESAFRGANFSQFESAHLSRTTGGSFYWQLIKRALSWLPAQMQMKLTSLLPKSRTKHKFVLEQKNRIFSLTVNPFPKEISLTRSSFPKINVIEETYSMNAYGCYNNTPNSPCYTKSKI
jgi:hypothetical protein